MSAHFEYEVIPNFECKYSEFNTGKEEFVSGYFSIDKLCAILGRKPEPVSTDWYLRVSCPRYVKDTDEYIIDHYLLFLSYDVDDNYLKIMFNKKHTDLNEAGNNTAFHIACYLAGMLSSANESHVLQNRDSSESESVYTAEYHKHDAFESLLEEGVSAESIDELVVFLKESSHLDLDDNEEVCYRVADFISLANGDTNKVTEMIIEESSNERYTRNRIRQMLGNGTD